MKKLSILFLCSVCVLTLTACGDSAESLYNKGEEALQDEDYETAIEDFTAAIEANSDYVEAYLERAKAYLEQGETEDALALAKADYDKVIELDESNVDGTLGIADIYIRRGDIDEAQSLLEEALEITDNDEAIEDKLAEFDSGEISDSSGHLRRRTGYNGSGEMLWYHEMNYDEEGKESSVTSYDQNGNQTNHVDIVYNDFGKRDVSYTWSVPTSGDSSEPVRLASGNLEMPGTLVRIEYEYDESGYSIKTTDYSFDGSVQSTETYERDSSGNITKRNVFILDTDRLYYSTAYEYDEDGNVIKETNITATGNENSYTLYEYDANGHNIKQTTYLNGELYETRIYTYDNNGKQIKSERYDASGNLKDYNTREYNE